MNTKGVMADFQLLGNRVRKLVIDTRIVGESGRAEVSIEMDYQVSEVEIQESKFLGTLTFIVHVKAKIKNKILFKVELEMEGAFAGNSEKIPEAKFTEMLEMNGLITLLHISRAYLLSVTSQSGIQPPVKIPMINVLKLREKKVQQNRKEKNF